MNGKNKIPGFGLLAAAIIGLCGTAFAPPPQANPGPRPAVPVILGIFGGMGPEATANLYQLIVKLTPAEKDQDHIPTLMFSNPQVPDRTTAIQTGDKSIIPCLVEGVARLEKAGASLIAIPCNTAHYFYDDMQRAVRIPIIHMIRETVAEVANRYPNARTIGLLATSGTIASGLYEKEFTARGIAVVTPDPDIQEKKVMAAVYGIKAGTKKKQAEDLLFEAGRNVESRGAQVMVLGCTEIPLAFNPDRASVPVVNATKVLAERSIAKFRELETAAAAAAGAAGGAGEPNRCRARDTGLSIGVLPTGSLNSITDVAGVRVGHVTVNEGESVRTGVTAVLPHGGNLFQEKVAAAVYVGNGFGKLTGTTQIEELGNLETPIILTNTLSVPDAAAALVDYTLRLPGNENVQSVNAVVGETNDGWLNDIRGRYVRAEHVREAIARADGGPVDEGCVGAGTGTVCFGFKGGIGTSSRRLPARLGGYTAGVLVQSNFGGVLQIAGAPVGIELGRYFLKDELGRPDGSCMMIVATDAPLSSRNLKRLAKRAILGLARTGGIASNGSGDYVIAFSTAKEGRVTYASEKTTLATADLNNDALSPLFLAVEEAAEEAILNSLFTAVSTRGRDGHFAEALPLDRVLPILAGRGLSVHPPAEAGK